MHIIYFRGVAHHFEAPGAGVLVLLPIGFVSRKAKIGSSSGGTANVTAATAAGCWSVSYSFGWQNELPQARYTRNSRIRACGRLCVSVGSFWLVFEWESHFVGRQRDGAPTTGTYNTQNSTKGTQIYLSRLLMPHKIEITQNNFRMRAHKYGIYTRIHSTMNSVVVDSLSAIMENVWFGKQQRAHRKLNLTLLQLASVKIGIIKRQWGDARDVQN